MFGAHGLRRVAWQGGDSEASLLSLASHPWDFKNKRLKNNPCFAEGLWGPFLSPPWVNARGDKCLAVMADGGASVLASLPLPRVAVSPVATVSRPCRVGSRMGEDGLRNYTSVCKL